MYILTIMQIKKERNRGRNRQRVTLRKTDRQNKRETDRKREREVGLYWIRGLSENHASELFIFTNHRRSS